MDLGTIAKKIDRKRYTTMGQLAYDIELIFAKYVLRNRRILTR